MMLFIYELVSAGGMGKNVPPAMRAEGWAMLAALVEDFCRLPGMRVSTLLADDRPSFPGVQCHRAQRLGAAAAFREAVAVADAVLVVAPECQDLLATCNDVVLRVGKELLGCMPAAVRLAADKLTLARYWELQGVPTPPTDLFVTSHEKDAATWKYPLIVKPRHGAGAQATFMAHNSAELHSCVGRAARQAADDDLLVQPFLPGMAASVSFLCGPNACLPLPAGQQFMALEGAVRYTGGSLPLEEPLARRAALLGMKALEGIQGLAGFVGVDLVLGPATDGSQDAAIEINPRVTSSYLGLRRLCRDNLAQAIIEACAGREARLRWRQESVQFHVEYP